jgi:hypothetical protein
LFGVDKNSGNAIFSIMSERVHEYNGMLVNKFPVFQFNPELFGMVFLALGFLIIVEAIFKKLNN